MLTYSVSTGGGARSGSRASGGGWSGSGSTITSSGGGVRSRRGALWLPPVNVI